MAIILLFIWTMLFSFNILEILLEVKGYLLNNKAYIDDGKFSLDH